MIPILEISIWLVAKVFVLIAFFLYIIFSVVVVRQVELMTSTLEVGFETQLKLLSYLHLAFAVFVFFAALIIL